MKIICVGRNYASHALELKNELPKEPVIFLKPESCINQETKMELNPKLGTIHYECELILKMNKHIPLYHKIQSFEEVCNEFSLGIDFTARAVQDRLKSKGLPWELAKAFDQSVFIGRWKSIDKFTEFSFQLLKNGQQVQKGDTTEMIFSIVEIINFCTDYFSFQEGDILFTGTPEGVGLISVGDEYVGVLDGKDVFMLNIV